MKTVKYFATFQAVILSAACGGGGGTLGGSAASPSASYSLESQTTSGLFVYCTYSNGATETLALGDVCPASIQ